MEEDILSFINKLPPIESLPPFRQGGLKVESKIKEVKKRLPSLPDHKLISLAIFTQHLELSLFTDRELLAVANKRLDLLSANPNQDFPSVIGVEQGLVDTSSPRIYNLLSLLGVPTSQISFMMARSQRSSYDLLTLLEV
jgi:hypothetical protein